MNSDWLKNTPIAHRGLYDNVTVAENSRSAILKAIDSNYAIELDLSLTADNHPIVFHDESLSRMTDIYGYVNNTPFDTIKKERLLKSDDQVLSVEEALSIVDGRVPILFNISGDLPTTSAKFFYDAVKDYSGEFAVSSSNPYTLEWFKLNAPRIKRGQRAGAFKKKKPTYGKKGQLKKLKLNHISEPNFIVYRVEDAKKRYFKSAQKNGLPVVLWTVRTKKDNRKAEKLNANKIFEM